MLGCWPDPLRSSPSGVCSWICCAFALCCCAFNCYWVYAGLLSVPATLRFSAERVLYHGGMSQGGVGFFAATRYNGRNRVYPGFLAAFFGFLAISAGQGIYFAMVTLGVAPQIIYFSGALQSGGPLYLRRRKNGLQGIPRGRAIRDFHLI